VAALSCMRAAQIVEPHNMKQLLWKVRGCRHQQQNQRQPQQCIVRPQLVCTHCVASCAVSCGALLPW
jgi:hypothetical protein